MPSYMLNKWVCSLLGLSKGVPAPSLKQEKVRAQMFFLCFIQGHRSAGQTAHSFHHSFVLIVIAGWGPDRTLYAHHASFFIADNSQIIFAASSSGSPTSMRSSTVVS